MLHVRIVSPPAQRDELVRQLLVDAAVCNVIVLPGVAQCPDGDLVQFDVAREHANELIDALQASGLERHGSISIIPVDVSLSRAARDAERAAPGEPDEAVVWEEVEQRIHDDSDLSVSYVLFLVIAVLIGAAGILTDSSVLIVGAMVTGPEYGALAAVSYGLDRRHRGFVRRGLISLGVGFPLGIVAATIATLVVRALDAIPAGFVADERPLTSFVSNPDGFSVLVATLAAIAGTLSLTEARAGTLVGVLISVTTVPAASNIGVSLALGDASEVVGASAQLLVNLVCLVVVGALTLAVQRRWLARLARPAR